MARKIAVQPDEIPVLPPFASEDWNVTVLFDDDSIETIPVWARGPAAALRTAVNTMERWPAERISQIMGLQVSKSSRSQSD